MSRICVKTISTIITTTLTVHNYHTYGYKVAWLYLLFTFLLFFTNAINN